MKNLDVLYYFTESVGQASSSKVLINDNYGKSDNLFCLVNDDHFNYVPDDRFDDELSKIKSIIKQAKSKDVIKLNLLLLLSEIFESMNDVNNFKNNIRKDFQNNNNIRIESMNGEVVKVIRVDNGSNFDKNKLLTVTDYKLISTNTITEYGEKWFLSDDFISLLNKVENKLNSY